MLKGGGQWNTTQVLRGRRQWGRGGNPSPPSSSAGCIEGKERTRGAERQRVKIERGGRQKGGQKSNTDKLIKSGVLI